MYSLAHNRWFERLNFESLLPLLVFGVCRKLGDPGRVSQKLIRTVCPRGARDLSDVYACSFPFPVLASDYGSISDLRCWGHNLVDANSYSCACVLFQKSVHSSIIWYYHRF